MTLFTDLEKDMAVIGEGKQVMVSDIFEMLCNLIDIKFAKLEQKITYDIKFHEDINHNQASNKG